jgi:hypothetical protein
VVDAGGEPERVGAAGCRGTGQHGRTGPARRTACR